ncbi:MAG: twin-arginine translocase TatA/TatE family subunit [Microbacterium sp.]|uniref:twin-arginine translocase TatA/TatE family subunit n=1 Tax=Microbacterium sp. TaxID=51671 RepID=UPI0039E4CF26
MFANLSGWHLLLVLAVVLLLFGATRLPALAKGLGQSARAFKGELRGIEEDEAASAARRPAVPAEPESTRDVGDARGTQ